MDGASEARAAVARAATLSRQLTDANARAESLAMDLTDAQAQSAAANEALRTERQRCAALRDEVEALQAELKSTRGQLEDARKSASAAAAAGRPPVEPLSPPSTPGARTPRSSVRGGHTPRSRAAVERLTQSAALLEEEMREITGLIQTEDEIKGRDHAQSERMRLAEVRQSAGEIESENAKLKAQCETLKKLLHGSASAHEEESRAIEGRLRAIKRAVEVNNEELSQYLRTSRSPSSLDGGSPDRLLGAPRDDAGEGADGSPLAGSSAVVQAHHAAATAAIDAIGPPPSDVGVFMGGGFGGAAARRAAGA